MLVFQTRIDDRWFVSLPGWSPSVLIGLPVDFLPRDILSKAEPLFRCYAKVNTGEDDPFNLIFEDWEIPELCNNCGRGAFEATGDFSNFKMRCLNCFHVQ